MAHERFGFLAFAGMLLLSTACATAGAKGAAASGGKQVGEDGVLLVSTTESGRTMGQSTHNQAMSGVEVKDGKSLGVKNATADAGPLLCRSEMDTGTHFSHMVCRYQREIDRDRAAQYNDMMERIPKGTPKPGE